MNQEWQKVREFHQVFDTPHPDTPCLLTESQVQRRAAWIREELEELIASTTIEDQADALIDTIYFAMGALVEMGVEPENIFNIVHEANMSKCWEDGKPRYRESDGKIIKPPTWEEPQPKIHDEIERQKRKKR